MADGALGSHRKFIMIQHGIRAADRFLSTLNTHRNVVELLQKMEEVMQLQ